MFRSIYLKTLRDYRIAILGWGIGMGLVLVELIAGVSALESTPGAMAALGSLAASFAWNASAVAVTTPGGYATWKLGTFIFLICVWPLLSSTRTLRGEEERGSLDVLLSVPRGRARVALEKVGAIWTALLLMGLIIALITYATAAKFNADISIGDALLFGFNISLVCMVFGGVGVFVSQFTQERGTAAGITAGVLLVAIVVDMVHRVFSNTEWISRLSPIYYYNLSKPLVPSFGTSLEGLLVQLGLAAVLTAGGIWFFVRRDAGAPVPLPAWLRRPQRASIQPAALPAGDWSIRSVYARSLAMIAPATFWWTVAIAGFAAWMVAIVKQFASQFQELAASAPAFKQVLDSLGGGGAALNDALLSAIFTLIPVLLMAFAVTQVNRWTSDADEGRLELVLATPRSRHAVLLGRFAALATATVIIGVVMLLATSIASVAGGVPLDEGNVAAACLGMIPLGLLTAALGYLAAGWLRTAADTGLLSFLLAAWFFITFVGPELKLPDAAMRLSPFYYYGTPLLHGLQVVDTIFIVVVAGVALALGVLRFSRRDIAV